jgi:hypothetical protein
MPFLLQACMTAYVKEAIKNAISEEQMATFKERINQYLGALEILKQDMTNNSSLATVTSRWAVAGELLS